MLCTEHSLVDQIWETEGAGRDAGYRRLRNAMMPLCYQEKNNRCERLKPAKLHRIITYSVISCVVTCRTAEVYSMDSTSRNTSGYSPLLFTVLASFSYVIPSFFILAIFTSTLPTPRLKLASATNPMIQPTNTYCYC